MLQDENEQHRDMTMFETWLRDTFRFDTMEGAEDRANWMTSSQISKCFQREMGFKADDSVGRRLHVMCGKSLQTHINGIKGRYYKIPASCAGGNNVV